MDCSARAKSVRRTIVACFLHRVVEEEPVTVLSSSARRMTAEPVVILTFEVVPLEHVVWVLMRKLIVFSFMLCRRTIVVPEFELCGLGKEPSAPKQVAHVPCSAASRLSDGAATGLWESTEEGRSGGATVLDDWIDARMARELRACGGA